MPDGVEDCRWPSPGLGPCPSLLILTNFDHGIAFIKRSPLRQ